MGYYFSKPSNTCELEFFFQLPEVVQREVLSYLKPWELFKLSRVSNSWKTLITSKTLPIESMNVHIGKSCLAIRAEFEHHLPRHPSIVYSWSFYGLDQKPLFKKRTTNHNHYNRQMDTFTYHEEPEKALLFTLSNFLELFKIPKGRINQFTIHTDRIYMFGTITRMSAGFKEVTVMTQPNCPMDLEGFLAEKLGTLKVEKLTIQTMENIKILTNPSPSNCFHLDPVLLKPTSSDVELNALISYWLAGSDKTLNTYWHVTERDIDKEVVLNGLNTIPWDRTCRFLLPGQVQSLATGWNTVVVTRDDGRRAVITVSERTVGFVNFAMAVMN